MVTSYVDLQTILQELPFDGLLVAAENVGDQRKAGGGQSKEIYRNKDGLGVTWKGKLRNDRRGFLWWMLFVRWKRTVATCLMNPHISSMRTK